MDVVDIIPELLTVGTLTSSVFGVYFERIRKKLKSEEPQQMEAAGTEAAAQVSVEPPASVSPEFGTKDKITIAGDELKKLLDTAVSDGADAAITAMKSELTDERIRDRRASLRANIAFFVAGIMATVAITLYVHPLQ